MQFNVTLLNNNEKRYYLIEITDEVTVWCVEKRFKELYLLKEALSKKFNYKFTSFPKKRLTYSYRSDILNQRLTGFNLFFGTIANLNYMLGSDIFQNFIRSNVYLETYENIRQADQIRDSFVKSKELQHKVASILSDCQFLDDEIKALQGKNEILIRNLQDIQTKNGENLDLFVQAKDLKLSSSREKNKSIQYLKELDDLYATLRRQIVLVNVLKSSTIERLDCLRDNTIELEADLLTINVKVDKISDPVLTHKFHLAEFQAINQLYLEKINGQIKKITPNSNQKPRPKSCG